MEKLKCEKCGKNKFRACAVGCAIHSLNLIKGKDFPTGDHSVYETELGIPRILAKLEDRIFEGLSVDESKTFPERFISAIPVGVDLKMVWPKFAVWMLGDKEHGVIKYAKSKNTTMAIQGVLDLYIKKVEGKEISASEWVEVRKNAAAYAYADAADAAASAASAAAASAASAADAAASAAYATYAADAAAYAYAADAAARKKHYSLMADKLIEIVSSEK